MKKGCHIHCPQAHQTCRHPTAFEIGITQTTDKRARHTEDCLWTRFCCIYWGLCLFICLLACSSSCMATTRASNVSVMEDSISRGTDLRAEFSSPAVLFSSSAAAICKGHRGKWTVQEQLSQHQIPSITSCWISQSLSALQWIDIKARYPWKTKVETVDIPLQMPMVLASISQVPVFWARQEISYVCFIHWLHQLFLVGIALFSREGSFIWHWKSGRYFQSKFLLVQTIGHFRSDAVIT